MRRVQGAVEIRSGDRRRRSHRPCVANVGARVSHMLPIERVPAEGRRIGVLVHSRSDHALLLSRNCPSSSVRCSISTCCSTTLHLLPPSAICELLESHRRPPVAVQDGLMMLWWCAHECGMGAGAPRTLMRCIISWKSVGTGRGKVWRAESERHWSLTSEGKAAFRCREVAPSVR